VTKPPSSSWRGRWRSLVEGEQRQYRSATGERIERFLDRAAEPSVIGGRDLRVFWNGVPHIEDQDNPDDKDWAASEPDPKAP